MNTTFENTGSDLFENIGFFAKKSDTCNIKLYLMSEIKRFIKNNGLTQEKAANLMDVSRPRISDVVRDKTEKFTIDALIQMLSNINHRVAVTVLLRD